MYRYLHNLWTHNIPRKHVGIGNWINYEESIYLLKIHSKYQYFTRRYLYLTEKWVPATSPSWQYLFFPQGSQSILTLGWYNRAGGRLKGWYTSTQGDAANLKLGFVGYEFDFGCVFPSIKQSGLK